LTNLVAFLLALLVIAGIVVDLVFFGADNLVFLSRKLLELIEWLAFWR
jgi:hypothetical protein